MSLMEKLGLKSDVITSHLLVKFGKLSTKSEKVECLLNSFKLNITSELDDSHIVSVVLDIIVDHLSFAVDYGLNWTPVQIYFEFIDGLILDTVAKGLIVEDAVVVFQDKVKRYLEPRMPMAFIKAAVDYLSTSFFQHYWLYLYFFTSNRDELSDNVHLSVIPPEHSGNEVVEQKSIPLLKNGIPIDKWTQEQKLKEVDTKWDVKAKERQQKYEISQEEVQTRKNKVDTALETSLLAGDRSKVDSCLTDMIVNAIDGVSLALKYELGNVQDNLDYRIEKGTVGARVRENGIGQLKPRSKSGLKSGKL